MFLKIFLWFWLAIAVVIGVLVTVTAVTNSEPPISLWRNVANEAMNVYAVSVAEIYEREGEAGLQKYLNRVQGNSEIKVFVFDDDNRRLAPNDFNSAEIPPNLIQKARTSEETEFNFLREFAIAARKVSLQNKSLVLAVQMPRPRLPANSVETETRILRILAVVLAAGLVCYGLARYLTSPLTKLRQATKALARGDLSVRVADKIGRRRDEISSLAKDFDEMAMRIENLVAAQKNLTTDISHELRSPLARLGVALEIARAKANPETQPALDRIERESIRLNEMIGQTLLLSKLEAGAQNMPKTKIDLSNLVRETVADADFEAKSQNKTVKLVADEQCFVRGDEQLLASAIENVVRNGVRHTPENTAVEVSLENKNRNAIIVVRDFGTGVPAEDLDKLFRPFYRVGFARERSAGGFGLGLAITRRAIEAHGGQVTAENAPDNGLIVKIEMKAEP